MYVVVLECQCQCSDDGRRRQIRAETFIALGINGSETYQVSSLFQVLLMSTYVKQTKIIATQFKVEASIMTIGSSIRSMHRVYFAQNEPKWPGRCWAVCNVKQCQN